ncbi:MAG TPA: hypothetical protein PKC41_10250 [Chitinophagaceae bacterium]|jgi:hypothetical protein|nr:hypothetical protein [Chitinophagaceae bacterium]
MCYTINDLEPFTYYKDPIKKRGFLLANIVPDEGWNYVLLLEFGRNRNFGIKQPIPDFLKLINDGRLLKFTPQVN